LTENLPVLDGLHVVINTPEEAKLALENIDETEGLRFFELIKGASLTIDGVSFIGGKGENGGAISVDNSNLELTNVLFQSNIASGNGGVIYASNGEVEIDTAEFISNSAENGGSIYAIDGSFSLSNSVFNYSYAESGTGGAIYSESTSFDMNTVDIKNGKALYAAGIFMDNGTEGSSALTNLGLTYNDGRNGAAGAAHFIGDIAVGNSFFRRNRSLGGDGTGAVILESGVELYNSTMYDNKGARTAILLKSDGVKLWNLTLIDNGGRGVTVESGTSHSISNSIFDGLDGLPIGSDYGHNLFQNPYGIELQGNTEGNIDATNDAWYNVHIGYELFYDPINDEDGRYMDMPPCSGAINAGVAIPGSENDQIGQTRVGATDIGAVEFQGTPISVGHFTYELVADKELVVCDSELLDVTFRMEVSPDESSPYVDELEFEYELNEEYVDIYDQEFTLTGLKAGDELLAYVYADGQCLDENSAEVTVEVKGQLSAKIFSEPAEKAFPGQLYEYPISSRGEGVVTVDVTDDTTLPDWLELTQSEDSDEVISVAGSTRGNTDGTGENAQFFSELQLAFDQVGNLIVSDYWNESVRKVTEDGEVSTIVGDLNRYVVRGVDVGPDGYIYYVDQSVYGVKRIDAEGNVEHYLGLNSRNNQEGDQSSAGLNYPVDLAFGPDGALYITDKNDGYIMKWYDGYFSRFASVSSATYLTVSEDGMIYVSVDNSNNIYKVDQQGVVTDFVGSSSEGLKDGYGSAALFYGPAGLDMDLNGNLIVADQWNSAIRMVTPDGYVSTLAGGIEGDGVGEVTDQMFSEVTDVAVHPQSGDIYIADNYNYKIKKLSVVSDYMLSGTPDEVGTFDVSLTATGEACNNDTQSFTISITETDPR
jgi:predicted outer membrane repeat protein